MRSAVKEKVTVSVDPKLVDAVDQEVRAHHADSRSAVVEEALQRWRVEQQRRAIEQGIEQYYHACSQKEQQEDRTWTRVTRRHAQRRWDD